MRVLRIDGRATVKGLGALARLCVAILSLLVLFSGEAAASPSVQTGRPAQPDGPSSISFLGASPPTSVFGQNVAFSYNVSGGGGMPACTAPTGTVDLVEGVTTVASASLPSAVNTSALSVGFHSLFLRYNGDGNCNSSITTIFGYSVVHGSTSTSLSSSLNPSQRGQSVTFTAVVSAVAPASGTPTGLLTFYNGAAPLGTVALGGGTAAFSTSALPRGTHNISAVYNGSGSFNGSTSNTVVQVVRKTGVTVSLTSSPNPSRCGELVTFTATVTPLVGGVGTPSGVVSFDDGDVHLATRALNNAGVATFTTSSLDLAVGLHLVRATYEGDEDFDTGTSTTIDHLVIKADTTITLTRSPAGSTVYGQYVQFTAQLAAVAPGAGIPSGFVLFQDNGNTIGVGFIDGTGKATFTTMSLDVGTHPMTAVYGGDDCFNGSSSSTLNHTVNKADTQVTLTRSTDCGSANPSRFGQRVFFTALVEAQAPGGGIPPGTVTFKDGATILETVDLNSDGSATFATQSLSVGGHTITATYNGSVNYNTSVSSGMGHTVNKADTSVTITDPAGTVNYLFGQAFLMKATLTVLPCGQAGPWGVPTGKVRFTFSPSVTFNGQPYLEADVAGDGSIIANAPITDLPNVGSYTVTAQYMGDANFNASAASAGRTINIFPASTTVTVATSLSPSVYGQAIDFTVTVAVVSPGGNIPNTTNPIRVTTGTVLLTLTPSVGPAILLNGSLTLTPGQPFTGMVMIPGGILPVGTYNVQATYVPATLNFLGGVSPLYMGAANVPQVVVKANTVTSITSSVNPALSGQNVTLTSDLVIASPGSGVPTGTVAFKNGGVPIPGCGAVALVGLTATCNTAFMTGSYTLTAEYSGDANFNGSTSGGYLLVVVTSPTTLTLVDTSVPNPTSFGQPASFKATVSPPAATGFVTFKRAAIDIVGCVNVPVAAAMATCTTSALPAGDNPISAVFTPTSDHSGSSSAVIFHTVNKAATNTVLTRSPNASTVCGQPITFTATVTSAFGTPTGQVVFKADGTNFATVNLAAGVASFTIANLTAGAHVISAVYLGDTNFATSTGTLNHTVNPGSSTSTVLSSTNPSVFGQSVTFTATVVAVAPSTGTPSGIVNFKDGASVIGSATLSPAGVATFTTTMLAVGARSITAEYLGNGCYAPSTSAVLVQTVNKANTTVTVIGNPSPSIFGAPVTFTATVAAVAPGGGIPTGTVTFKDGAANIAGCVAVPLIAGVATCTTSTLPVGLHTINADYSGSAEHNASTGSTSHLVSDTPVDLAILKTSNPQPVAAGADLTYTITVTNLSATATSATMTDPLPPEVTHVSTTPAGGWTCSGTSTVTCNTAAIAAMSSAVITIVVHVPETLPAGTVLANTASVSGGLPDPNPDNNSSRNETTVYRFRRPF